VISGCVADSGTPVVELEIGGRSWTATIDTGFNGDLELPYALGQHVNARFFGVGSADLAGGVTIDEEYYRVDFPFDGATAPAIASFVDGTEILIGTRLLQAYRLEVDFPRGTVLIQRGE
jgi:predicted aspartyl protease